MEKQRHEQCRNARWAPQINACDALCLSPGLQAHPIPLPQIIAVRVIAERFEPSQNLVHSSRIAPEGQYLLDIDLLMAHVQIAVRTPADCSLSLGHASEEALHVHPDTQYDHDPAPLFAYLRLAVVHGLGSAPSTEVAHCALSNYMLAQTEVI